MDGEISDVTAGFTPNLWSKKWSRIKTWGLRLIEFGFVQGLVQLLSAIAGFLIIRGLSKPEYALFGIVNSMQSTANLLADVGIGIGVRSLGGRVWNDPERFGQLLNTTLSLRRKFATFSLFVTVPVTAWMLWRNGGDIWTVIGLCLIMVISVIPLLGDTAWRTSAQLHGEYRRLQKLGLGNAIIRCSLIGLMFFSYINVLLASLVGSIGNWVQLIVLRHWAKPKINRHAPISQDDRRELLRLSLKSLPNAIFFCFQGQVTLLIFTVLGNASDIANVMALGRIAVLFTIFSVTFSNVLSPRFARCQDARRLPRIYLLLICGSAFLMLGLSMVAWLMPEPFLWLLGHRYTDLGNELVWVVAASCVSQIAGVMWSLNSSKAWIRFQAPWFIPSILVVQVIAAIFLNLRTFHDVLIFNLATAAAPLPGYMLDAYLGLWAKVSC